MPLTWPPQTIAFNVMLKGAWRCAVQDTGSALLNDGSVQDTCRQKPSGNRQCIVNYLSRLCPMTGARSNRAFTSARPRATSIPSRFEAPRYKRAALVKTHQNSVLWPVTGVRPGELTATLEPASQQFIRVPRQFAKYYESCNWQTGSAMAKHLLCIIGCTSSWVRAPSPSLVAVLPIKIAAGRYGAKAAVNTDRRTRVGCLKHRRTLRGCQ